MWPQRARQSRDDLDCVARRCKDDWARFGWGFWTDDGLSYADNTLSFHHQHDFSDVAKRTTKRWFGRQTHWHHIQARPEDMLEVDMERISWELWLVFVGRRLERAILGGTPLFIAMRLNGQRKMQLMVAIVWACVL